MSTQISDFHGKYIKKINIPRNLKLLRKVFNVSLNELSTKTNLKLNRLKEYEFYDKNPGLDALLVITQFFGTSLDFFLLWNYTNYPKNLNLLKLAKEIDNSKNTEYRTNLEITIKLLLEKANNSNTIIVQDQHAIKLSNNLNENIKLLRENQQISQRILAIHLDINQSQIAHYQKKSIPPLNNLIKLAAYFNISVHYLVTGEKLLYNFKSKSLENKILLADQNLNLSEHKLLITLMEKILQ